MTLGKMILKKNKAVSPVIATILLIALTVTAAAIVYFVVVPLLKPKVEITVTGYGFVTGTDDQFEFTVNVLTAPEGGATISAVAVTFFNGSETNAPVVQGFTEVVISQGSSQKITITVSPDFIDGEQYTIIITYDGGKTAEVSETK
ncbi:MAG: archaellin/type IV pilin N-terminal domain-containing protein [Candidatus Thorarchaeota archaeon]